MISRLRSSPFSIAAPPTRMGKNAGPWHSPPDLPVVLRPPVAVARAKRRHRQPPPRCGSVPCTRRGRPPTTKTPRIDSGWPRPGPVSSPKSSPRRRGALQTRRRAGRRTMERAWRIQGQRSFLVGGRLQQSDSRGCHGPRARRIRFRNETTFSALPPVVLDSGGRRGKSADAGNRRAFPKRVQECFAPQRTGGRLTTRSATTEWKPGWVSIHRIEHQPPGPPPRECEVPGGICVPHGELLPKALIADASRNVWGPSGVPAAA